MQQSMALSKLPLPCSLFPFRKQSSAFSCEPFWPPFPEESLILRDWGRWCSSAFMKVIQSSYIVIMNIVAAKGGAVSLKELIPEHESLKLLILHTPFSIDISSLSQCLNLVKLDLSNNNLAAFPYLGHLRSLRIIFLHDNHLTFDHFVAIFQRPGQESALAHNVVWITFWGNRQAFLARHFAANNTSAIAFDRNIIVEEEKSGQLMPLAPSHSPSTDISSLLTKRANNYSTEEEYMQDFWVTLRLLRKKYEDLNPVIKIQKCYRGWIFREKVRRQFVEAKQYYLTLLRCFRAWRSSSGGERKLARILAEKRKSFLLYPNCRINRTQIEQRLRELARAARAEVLRRRLVLEHQIKFYSVLRGNYQALQDLYGWLQLKQSSAVYVHKDGLAALTDYIYPFVRLFCSQSLQISPNMFYHLHYMYSPRPSHRLQFIKIIKTNLFTVASYEKPLEKMLSVIKFRKPSALQVRMKAVFGKFHASKQQRQKMHEHERRIEEVKQEERAQLIRIEGSYQLLRTLVRGVFFYNSRRLSVPPSQQGRINILSEVCLRRISSAVAIQRAWKGYSFRKKHHGQLQIILKYQKAATLIQRWFRKLPTLRRRYFLFALRPLLTQIQDSFLLEFEEYKEAARHHKKINSIMLEQHAQVYKSKSNSQLVLTWDNQSERETVQDMIRIRKPLFNSEWLRREGICGQENRTVHLGELQPCDLAFLVHYQTESSLVRKGERKWVQVRCKSKAEAKLRVLGLALLTFNFRLKRAIRIMPASFFSTQQLNNRVEVGKQEVVVVCNENIGLIRVVEERCAGNRNIAIYAINNKTFLQFNLNKKPFKIEERFFLYLINFQATPLPLPKAMLHASLVDLAPRKECALRLSSHLDQPKLQRRPLPRKRSIRQFKAKVTRRSQHHPSFIIDNKSESTNNQSVLEHSVKEAPKEYSSSRRQAVLKVKASQLLQHRRGQQEEDFTRRFVNLGNFIQGQLANDHHRRIKTQIEQSAHNSAQQVRLSVQRSGKRQGLPLIVRQRNKQ